MANYLERVGLLSGCPPTHIDTPPKREKDVGEGGGNPVENRCIVANDMCRILEHMFDFELERNGQVVRVRPVEEREARHAQR